MRTLGTIEIVFGLVLVTFGIYAIGLDVFWSHEDRHGYLAMFGEFGAASGGLVAFAGAVLAFAPRYRWSGHIPLLAVGAVFAAAYGEALV